MSRNKNEQCGWSKIEVKYNPVLRWIDKNNLLFDRQYQRPQAIDKARAIASVFSWVAFGAILVSRRIDGMCFIIDGGHRALAAKLRDEISIVPCIVFDGLSQEEEARAFVLVNKSRKPPSGIDIYRAQITAKDSVALQTKEVLDRHSISIGKGAANTIASIIKAQKLQKDGMLDEVLSFIEDVWPGDPSRFNEYILLGVQQFIRILNKRDIEIKQAIEKIRSTSIASIIQMSSTLLGIYVGKRVASITEALICVYNKGRRNKIPSVLNGPKDD